MLNSDPVSESEGWLALVVVSAVVCSLAGGCADLALAFAMHVGVEEVALLGFRLMPGYTDLALALDFAREEDTSKSSEAMPSSLVGSRTCTVSGGRLTCLAWALVPTED
jgi:hypothetical protein